MQGYYRDAGLHGRRCCVRDGWLATGDLARRDPDGALFIAGRSKELIIRSGFKVYPLEVETVLNAHPAVTQSAVVGRALPDGNEEVVAFAGGHGRQIGVDHLLDQGRHVRPGQLDVQKVLTPRASRSACIPSIPAITDFKPIINKIKLQDKSEVIRWSATRTTTSASCAPRGCSSRR
jgi:acyl-CoA synthetase (AMP-forming)/AMP-acid ligase II